MINLFVRQESWPIRGSFTISRGSKTAADVVVVELHKDGLVGRGECVPYARYGESCQGVSEIISSLTADLASGLTRQDLQTRLPAGAARNALDCAFWDLESKGQNCRSWDLANMPSVEPMITAYTLSLDTPEQMNAKAREHADRPLLKLKLAGPGDLDRVKAVRAGAPKTRIIVDANEGWTPEIYAKLAPELVDLGVSMIEQPLPAGKDQALAEMQRPLPVCADESCHDRTSLTDILGKYDMINIKLDKTGGLTEALALKAEAQAQGLEIMAGCMLASSLAMAPAMLIGQGAAVVDLDGPLLLEKDRENGIEFDTNYMYPPSVKLWG